MMALRTLDSGLQIVEGMDGAQTLIFDDSRADLCIRVAREYGFKRLNVSSYNAYASRDLKAIMPLSDFVEELSIGQSSDKSRQISYEGLEEFRELRVLSMPDNGRDVVDLSSFPDLGSLQCNITKRLKGLETCAKLEWLGANSFNSASKDLTTLPPLLNLKHLTLGITNVVTLDGIDRFGNLRELEVYRATKLEYVAALRDLSGTLEELDIEACKRVKDFESLGRIRSLKRLHLSESGVMKSLAWVQELPHLEFLTFWGTNVLDGDVSYCEGIGYCAFDNKRHYNRKSEDFERRQ
jgi:hypothetical protein